MTTFDRFDRTVAEWLHEESVQRVPDHLGDVLARTSRTRQRPAWSSLERWLPVDMTFRQRTFALPPARALVLALVALALLAAVIFAIGSRRSRPAPLFGPARNGVELTSLDGDIYTLDPGGQRRPFITGSAYDFGASYSRDGSKLLFVRSVAKPSASGPDALTIVVANADGSGMRNLLGPIAGLDGATWSPDGTAVGYLTQDSTGKQTPHVIDVTTSKTVDIVVGPATTIDTAMWLPPHGHQLLVRGGGDAPGLFIVDADGSGAHEVSTRAPRDKFDYRNPAVSQDGASILYTTWYADKNLQRVRVLDIASGHEMELPTPDGTNQLPGVFSPDGRLVAYGRLNLSDSSATVVVAPADGSTAGATLGPVNPMSASGNEMSLAFTPDGKAVIARYGDDSFASTWLLAIDGSTSKAPGPGAFRQVDAQRPPP